MGTAPRLPSPFPERHHFSSLRISAYQLEPDVLCEEKSSQEDSLAVGVLNFAVVFMVRIGWAVVQSHFDPLEAAVAKESRRVSG